MTWWDIILCVILNGLWIVPFVHEIVISPIIDGFKIRKQNTEYIKKFGKRTRKICVSCKYCIWRWYHPFSYGKYYWLLASKMPLYCKKFRKHLRWDSSLRCISTLLSQAEYED